MAAYGSVDVDMDFAYDQDIDPEIALLHAQAEALNVVCSSVYFGSNRH